MGFTDKPLTLRASPERVRPDPEGSPDTVALNERESMKKFVALFTLLAVLTACGGGGGGRPSTDEIADALKDKDNVAGQAFTAGGATDEMIDCIAKALHDSDLSDDALNAIVDGDEDYEGDGEDEDAIAGLSDDIAKCITG